MFKKSGIVSVALLYLITATGFALNLHFCGSIIESVKINTPVKKCGMDSKCCKETHLVVKVKDAHKVAHTSFTDKILVFPVLVFSYASFHESSTVNHLVNLLTDRGPPPGSVPTYLQNCTFRI